MNDTLSCTSYFFLIHKKIENWNNIENIKKIENI